MRTLAWSYIAEKIGKSVIDTKKDVNDLRRQFNREHKKATKRVTGQSASAVYVPKWYLYTELLFLADRAAARKTVGNVSSFRSENGSLSNIDEDAVQDADGENLALDNQSATSSKVRARSAVADASAPCASQSSFDRSATHESESGSEVAFRAGNATEIKRKRASTPICESTAATLKTCVDRLLMASSDPSESDAHAEFGRFVASTLRQNEQRAPELRRKIVAVLFDLPIPSATENAYYVVPNEDVTTAEHPRA